MKEYIVKTNTQEETATVAMHLLKNNGFNFPACLIFKWNYVIKSENIKVDENAKLLNDEIPDVVKDLPVIYFEEWQNLK